MIDYNTLFTHALKMDSESVISFLSEELPYLWRDAYLKMTPHPTNILRITLVGFEYLFDCYSELEASGAVPYDKYIEDRLVAVYGRSHANMRLRESSRIKAWLGPTRCFLGSGRDKGHFIAHSIGGLVDGFEINLFSQLRSLNRGWSLEGKLFRQMEQYCASNPGTFVFNRPFYSDSTNRPSMIELGLLKKDGQFWVECFQN